MERRQTVRALRFVHATDDPARQRMGCPAVGLSRDGSMTAEMTRLTGGAELGNVPHGSLW